MHFHIWYYDIIVYMMCLVNTYIYTKVCMILYAFHLLWGMCFFKWPGRISRKSIWMVASKTADVRWFWRHIGFQGGYMRSFLSGKLPPNNPNVGRYTIVPWIRHGKDGYFEDGNILPSNGDSGFFPPMDAHLSLVCFCTSGTSWVNSKPRKIQV